MASEQSWTIGQLATTAGVTPRTIRYYTAEGLLPAPERRGTYAHYGEEHLLRLQLIAQLKAAYLPLGEIRARLRRLSVEQVRSGLVEHAGVDSVDSGMPDVPVLTARPSIGYKPSSAGNVPRAGLLVGSPADHATSTPRLKPGYASVLSQLVSQPSMEPATHHEGSQAETWQRITLAAGVELQVREPVAPAVREQVARLVQLARDLFLDDI